MKATASSSLENEKIRNVQPGIKSVKPGHQSGQVPNITFTDSAASLPMQLLKRTTSKHYSSSYTTKRKITADRNTTDVLYTIPDKTRNKKTDEIN